MTAPAERPAVPPVPAVRAGGLLVAEPCPFCGGRHTHGAAGGDGLRLAHCARGSYVLTPATPEPR